MPPPRRRPAASASTPPRLRPAASASTPRRRPAARASTPPLRRPAATRSRCLRRNQHRSDHWVARNPGETREEHELRQLELFLLKGRLDFCFFTDSATDATKEHRPRCECPCAPGGCSHRPGRGSRRRCGGCGRQVGPGCCWVEDANRCHLCVPAEPDPEPRAAAASQHAGRAGHARTRGAA